MLSLSEYLKDKRVSELQEFHSFWGTGETAPGVRAELQAALKRLMQDEQVVHRKLQVLSKAPMQLLLILVRSEDYRADIQSAFYNDYGIQLEYYEVEAAARALSRRGLIEISRDKNWINYGKEVYAIPREIGDTVSVLLAEERRGPKEVFTLPGHLTGLSRQKLNGLLRHLGYSGNGKPMLEDVQRFLLVEKGPAELLASVSNAKVRRMLVRLIEEYGGVISRSRYEQEVGAPVKWDRKRWQKFVEGAGLGTMSNIALDEYGIQFEGESIVVFRDVVEDYYRRREPENESFDRVLSARIDFLTDLAYFLRYAARNPIRVTQGKSLYKAAHAKIRDGMVFKDCALADREGVLSLIWDVVRELGLVELDDDRIVKLTAEGEAWESRDLGSQVSRIFEVFLAERAPEGRDFHQRKLRRILSQRLQAQGRNGWRPANELPFLARNDYLADLEEDGIRERYKNRFQYTYDPPKSTLPELARGLMEWVVERLFVLGLVEVAMVGDEPAAVRLTDLGVKGLGIEDDAAEGGSAPPLVVNPDFEILVFPEGDVLEIVHSLDRFAIRTKSEEVSHYRILKEGIERAVVKGMTADDILEFLVERSRTPIPQNVGYSIRNWAEKIRFATQSEAVLLEVDSEEVLDRVLALDRVKEILLRRVSPTAAALKERIEDWRTLEDLRGLGVYMKG